MYTMKISGPLVKALNNQTQWKQMPHAYLAAGSWCEITGYDVSVFFMPKQKKNINTC